MSDWLVLGLLAIGFYLYECCTWTPASASACFRRPLRRSWRAASGAELPGNESGGFAFADPLRLSGNYVQSADWPIAVSPEGICIDSPEAAQFWTFESIRKISAEEKKVRVNGEVAFRASSEALARELVDHLSSTKELTPVRRAEAIRASIGDTFDTEMLESTWSGFLKSSVALTRLAALPLVWLAGVTPIAMFLFGPLATWPYLLGGLFLSSLTVAVEFARVHRKELPDVSDRWLHVVSMTLFPIAAIRAADRISKELLAEFNPAAVAGVFCDEADAEANLRRTGFDLDRPVTSSTDPQVTRCREWYYAQKRSAFKGLLKSLGRDPFAPPPPLDAAMHVYCPRCHAQFGEGVDRCSDCEDVELTRFTESVAPRQRAGKKRKRA